jgi:hypothetical protein
MEQKEIDQIRKLYSHYGEPHQNTAVYHIRLLLKEIDRLVRNEEIMELKTASEWEDVYGVTVRDHDGWRTADAPSWDTPISREEWSRRMVTKNGCVYHSNCGCRQI